MICLWSGQIDDITPFTPTLSCFLSEHEQFDPKARYTFNSERDSAESELCRQQGQGKGSEECIAVCTL